MSSQVITPATPGAQRTLNVSAFAAPALAGGAIGSTDLGTAIVDVVMWVLPEPDAITDPVTTIVTALVTGLVAYAIHRFVGGTAAQAVQNRTP